MAEHNAREIGSGSSSRMLLLSRCAAAWNAHLVAGAKILDKLGPLAGGASGKRFRLGSLGRGGKLFGNLLLVSGRLFVAEKAEIDRERHRDVDVALADANLVFHRLRPDRALFPVELELAAARHVDLRLPRRGRGPQRELLVDPDAIGLGLQHAEIDSFRRAARSRSPRTDRCDATIGRARPRPSRSRYSTPPWLPWATAR